MTCHPCAVVAPQCPTHGRLGANLRDLLAAQAASGWQQLPPQVRDTDRAAIERMRGETS